MESYFNNYELTVYVNNKFKEVYNQYKDTEVYDMEIEKYEYNQNGSCLYHDYFVNLHVNKYADLVGVNLIESIDKYFIEYEKYIKFLSDNIDEIQSCVEDDNETYKTYKWLRNKLRNTESRGMMYSLIEILARYSHIINAEN